MYIDNMYVSIELLGNINIYSVDTIIKVEKLSRSVLELIRNVICRLYLSHPKKLEMKLFTSEEECEKYIKENKDEDVSYVICDFNNPDNILENIITKYIEYIYPAYFNPTYDWIMDGLIDYYKNQIIGLNTNGDKFKSFFLSNILNKKCTDKNLNYLAIRYMMKHFKPEHFSKILNDPDRVNNVYSYIFDKAIEKYSKLYGITDQIFDESYITNPETLMDYMDANIIYGWVDINGEEHMHTAKGLTTIYKVNSLETLRESHLGICVEQTNFIKYHLERLGYETKIITKRYVDPSDKSRLKLHCVCAFKDEKNKWYMFEHIVKQRKGITKFKSLDDLVEDMQFKRLDSTITIVPDLPEDLSFNELIDYISSYDIENSNKLKRELK